ncbi:hypothetical protein [Streptomyces lydicus]|uniref:hypothetical protein n=1 Tax=Streptomyces lydicus TaxID=47763 RepID=UPI003723D72C
MRVQGDHLGHQRPQRLRHHGEVRAPLGMPVREGGDVDNGNAHGLGRHAAARTAKEVEHV